MGTTANDQNSTDAIDPLLSQSSDFVAPARNSRVVSDRHADCVSDSVLLTRWILLPFYLGLVPALVVYAGRFLKKVAEFSVKGWSMSDNELLLAVLHLVDVVMVANLLVMIIIGGFASFIRRFRLTDEHTRLSWLSHVDAIALKVKMGLSLVGVSSIHLLELFIEVEQIETAVIVKGLAIHMVFVISTVAIAWIGRRQSHA